MKETFPLEQLNIEEAINFQFRLIDCITKYFTGIDILSTGDLGITTKFNRPKTTKKVENIIADFFSAEDAILVIGSGTNAIRLGLHSCSEFGDKILVHDAPIYPTTKTSIEMLGLKTYFADFHSLESIKKNLLDENIKIILIQTSRQTPDVHYNLNELIECIRSIDSEVKIITDDNYTVMKVKGIGCEYGADLATFSTFKLLGPEGIGCVVGNKKLIKKLRHENYSGGGQVQGHEALETLRGLIYAPVSLAISARVTDETVTRLNRGEVSGIRQAFVVNAQSRVIIVEFKEKIAQEVLKNANDEGAAIYPVGAESKYEFVPMFYQLSHTFHNSVNDSDEKFIRINPMRSGADTIIRILKASIRKVKEG